MKYFIILLITLMSLGAQAQTKKIAEISEPGKWLVYETGLTVEVDSVESVVDLLVKASTEKCSAWIIEVGQNMMCSVWLTPNGVQFVQERIRVQSSVENTRKKTKKYGSN